MTKINVPPPDRTDAQGRLALNRKVRMFYDLQRVRLQIGGRGLDRNEENAIQLHPEDAEILAKRAAELLKAEKIALKDVAEHLPSIAVYRDVFSDKERYRGIGPTMWGVILSAFAIEREDTPSKMWAFAGLAPIPARRCKKCHSVVEETDDDTGGRRWEHPATTNAKPKSGKRANVHTSPDGSVRAPNTKPICKEKVVLFHDTYESAKAMRPVRGEKLKYNAFLKTKLVGVLAPVLLKCGSPWRKFYDDYKHRKASANWGRSDAHRHQAAMRYMIKMLLLDIWREWRTSEGLPLRDSYQEQYLKHHHAERVATPDEEKRASVPTAPEHDERADEIAAEMEQAGL